MTKCLNTMAQTSTTKCICAINDGLFFCYECKSALCDTCRESHSKFPALKNHFVTDLKWVDRTAFSSASDCKTHNQEYSLICVKCVQLICSKCVASKHNGHKMSEIETIVNNERASAGKQVTQMKITSQNLLATIEAMKSVHIKKLQDEARTATERISSIAKDVHRVVDSTTSIKTTEVDAFLKVEKQQLESELANKERIYRRQTEARDRLDKLLGEKHSVTFFVSYKTLKAEVEQYLNLGDILDIQEPNHVPEVDQIKLIDEIIRAVSVNFGDSKKSSHESSHEDQKQLEEEVMIEEKIHMLPHSHRRGFPASDEDEDQDDSKNVILHLLWRHQDYFDQTDLSRAQAEYNFYMVIQKQWKKTLKRIQIDDLKYPKFYMKMFVELPRNRPLYAVILTILEQFKNKKPGEAAAEEYYKLRVLEFHMIQEHMITAIPPGLDLDEAHYNELFHNMKIKIRSSGRHAQMGQAVEFKTNPLFEYLYRKLKETMRSRIDGIDEFAYR